MNTLVVLPTYNEAATIAEVLRRTRRSVPDASVLVVDDGSPDGTALLAEEVGASLGGRILGMGSRDDVTADGRALVAQPAGTGSPVVHVMRRTERRGLGDAYRAGFAWGMERGFEAMVEMDSDLSHDPAALPDLLSALDTSDLVIGSRYVPGGSIPQWGVHRRLLSRGGNVYSALMLGVPVKDMTSGFRVYRASLLAAMDLDSVRADGYGFQIEMTYRAAQAGARIKEVPIRFVDREQGQSKMSSAIVVEALALVSRWGIARMLHRQAARDPRAEPVHASRS